MSCNEKGYYRVYIVLGINSIHPPDNLLLDKKALALLDFISFVLLVLHSHENLNSVSFWFQRENMTEEEAYEVGDFFLCVCHLGLYKELFFFKAYYTAAPFKPHLCMQFWHIT